MRILKIFIICLLSATSAMADTKPGVQFFEGSWSELLETAKKQGKLIFVDVYTDWCPPCKQMDREVFPLKEVGDSYNAMFINYRLDAEKGEGVQLAKKFAVKAYPTYLYLDAEGSLLYRAVGFQSPDALASNAKQAMSSSAGNNTISYFEHEFRSGKRDAGFLREYIKRSMELGLDNTPALNAYMGAVPADKLSTPGELQFLGENITGVQTNALDFVMSRFDRMNAEQRKKVADRLYSGVLYNYAGTALKEGKTGEMKQMLVYMEKLEPELSARQHEGVNKLRMLYYGKVKDIPKLKETGYRIVGNTMKIPMDSIRREDARMYDRIMEPFRSGKQDSTKIPNFEEEKQFIINQYSRRLSVPLYETAVAFADALEPKDPALADALQWAERVKELVPGNRKLDELIGRLRTLAP